MQCLHRVSSISRPGVGEWCCGGWNAPAVAATVVVFLPLPESSVQNGSPTVIVGPKLLQNGSPTVLVGPKLLLLLPGKANIPESSTTWVHRRLDSVSAGRPGHGISSVLSSSANGLPSLLHLPRLCWGCRLSSSLMTVRPLGTEAAGTRPVRSAGFPGRRVGC